jgi:hypothetical protein
MKKIQLLIMGLIGFSLAVVYNDYSNSQKELAAYGNRDVETELKNTVDRANLVLETVEKMYIKKEAPKPEPKPEPKPQPKPEPKPKPACECNGTKVLVQPDGNRVYCPCTNSAEGCKCKSTGEEQ